MNDYLPLFMSYHLRGCNIQFIGRIICCFKYSRLCIYKTFLYKKGIRYSYFVLFRFNEIFNY